MKKIFKKIISFILVLVIFSSTSFVFSEKKTSECKVKSTPKYITKYIKDIRIVIWNVNKTAIDKKKKEEEEEKGFFEKNFIGKTNSKN